MLRLSYGCGADHLPGDQIPGADLRALWPTDAHRDYRAPALEIGTAGGDFLLVPALWPLAIDTLESELTNGTCDRLGPRRGS
jgi:hypothetical protein